MRYVLLLMLILPSCHRYEVHISADIPEQKIDTSNNQKVICLSKKKEWAKEFLYNKARGRFNCFVAVIVDSGVDNKKQWVALPDGDQPWDMNAFALKYALEYRDYDIIIYADNPNGDKLGAPRVWYFERNIFDNVKSVEIWEVVTQWGFTMEKNYGK